MGSDEDLIDSLIARSRTAQVCYERLCDQSVYDRAIRAVGWALLEPSRNAELSRLAVESTGLGNVADKITKNVRKTKGLLSDLSDVRTCGIIEDTGGVVRIARPMGVVGAIVPSTNPVATPVNNIINALKCGNSIILSPSPKGYDVCELLLSYIHAEFSKIDLDCDLVQMVPSPVSKSRASLLMSGVDILVVTGSRDNVRRAYSSGTPTIGVGVGNVSVIVDETADLDSAAQKIALSKTFDNSTSCSSENALIVLDSVYESFLTSLSSAGGHLLTGEESVKLRSSLFTDSGLNRDLLAKDIDVVIERSGITVASNTPVRFLLLEGEGIGPDYPESGEKLSLVSTLYRATDFEDAITIASALFSHEGSGHSIGIHTTSDDRPLTLGYRLPTCRVIVNQPHCFATGGSFDNTLPFSLSMGCGSWGGNSIDDNFHYKHLLNITKVVSPVSRGEPSEDELFCDYWLLAGK